MAKKTLSKVAKSISPGGLHRSLGVPEGQKLKVSQLQPSPSDSTKVKRQKALARTFAKHRP